MIYRYDILDLLYSFFNNYIYFLKENFKLRENRLATILLFENMKEPMIYLIPSLEWLSPNSLLVSRDYINKKSEPEWGLNISQKNKTVLEQYQFDRIIEKI